MATVEGVMHALYVLWWVREQHVSVAVTATVLAAGDFAVMLLEVPTGWLADRFGHRASLITGSLLQIAGMLFAWLGAGVAGLLASSLIIAAGDTFRSGADQALLYRSCCALDEPAFQRIEARSRSLQLFALVALMLIGGRIVDTWGFHAGWCVETVISVIGLAIACAMREPPASLNRPPVGDVAAGPSPSLRPAGVLVLLLLPAAMVSAAASGMTFVIQASVGLEPTRMTTLVASAILAEAAGSFAGAHIRGGVRAQLWLGGAGFCILSAALVMPSTFTASAIILSFLMGLAHPVRAAAIQRIVSDSVRAQAASLASACDKALMTVAIVVAGVIPRRIS